MKVDAWSFRFGFASVNGLVTSGRSEFLSVRRVRVPVWLDPFEQATPARATDSRIAATWLSGLRSFIRHPLFIAPDSWTGESRLETAPGRIDGERMEQALFPQVA